jgi:hypothetical protein
VLILDFSNLPEVVNAIALVMHRPARPASFVKVDIENNDVIKTDKAPKASKFRRSQRFVIQKLYHIWKSQKIIVILSYKKRIRTLVVVSILTKTLLRNLFSAENALTVTIPSSISPKSEKMGGLAMYSILCKSRPVFRYPTANSR